MDHSLRISLILASSLNPCLVLDTAAFANPECQVAILKSSSKDGKEQRLIIAIREGRASAVVGAGGARIKSIRLVCVELGGWVGGCYYTREVVRRSI